MRLSTRNIDQRLPNSESRLIRFQLKVEDGIKFRVRNACVLCVFSNDIGDEKHSVCFPRTNPKLVGIRKTLIPEIHETFTPYPDVNPISHGGGGADSIHLQIVFFITSVRDAAEPQNLVIFPNI